MRHIYILCTIIFLFFTALSLRAQEATQSVIGIVVDNATKTPIPNASIELLNFLPLKITSTDEYGQFNLGNIPVGKHRLLITSEDYDVLIVPEIQISSGKQISLNIVLEKPPKELQEIVIKAKKINKSTKDIPNNHMALTGIRSFTIEELKRYPASFEDPARLVIKFAGVSRFNSETGIVVRGHNPYSVLWQIDGLPISSPNHMSFKEGATGFFPIFNIYLLQNSDFINGAFPAEYGNTTSGILDLGLRKGNRQNMEGSIKLSANAIEGFIEGPFDKNGRSSFIVGGRYSFLHFFAPIPIIPQTWDLSFKANVKTKNGEISFFGIGGFSSNNAIISELDTNDVGARFLDNYGYTKNYGLLGLNYKYQLLNKKGYVNTSIGSNYNLEQFNSFSDSIPQIKAFDSETISMIISSYLHYVFDDKHQIRSGLIGTCYNLDFVSIDNRKMQTIRNYQGYTLFLQAYSQWLYSISPKLKFNLGLNVAYLHLNHRYALSPRFAISWQVSHSHKLSFGYTWSYQLQAWETYFNQSNEADSYGTLIDKNLDFNRTHSLSLAYDWLIENNWRLKAEAYTQIHHNLPISLREPAISLVNHSVTQNLLEETHFINAGNGLTYGLELTFEKFFSNGYYGLFTATYFDSKYQSTDNIWRNTETNNNVITNLLFGKEFKIGRNKNNLFSIDFSYNFKLGNYYTPIDLNASIAAQEQILDWDKAYTLRLPALHYVDIRFSFVFNNKKKPISHRLIIEASNILHQQTVYRRVFNPYTNTIAEHSHPGISPNISYRINFGAKRKL